MSWAALVWYGARACLVAMFVFSAIDKVWHWDNALAQTRSSGLPGGRLVGTAMLIAAIVVEAVTPVMIVTGFHDRLGAGLLAGFCVVTGFLYHPFWRWHDFWIAADTSEAREHFWQFWKNLGLVGGLILVIFAGTLAAPADVARHPLASSIRP